MTGYGSLPQHWCSHCHNMIGHGCTCGLPVPMQAWPQVRYAPPPKPRSVVGTTCLVVFTLFVIIPVLLIGGCSVLAGVAALAGG